jgi:hypothetical protein
VVLGSRPLNVALSWTPSEPAGDSTNLLLDPSGLARSTSVSSFTTSDVPLLSDPAGALLDGLSTFMDCRLNPPVALNPTVRPEAPRPLGVDALWVLKLRLFSRTASVGAGGVAPGGGGDGEGDDRGVDLGW